MKFRAQKKKIEKKRKEERKTRLKTYQKGGRTFLASLGRKAIRQIFGLVLYLDTAVAKANIFYSLY